MKRVKWVAVDAPALRLFAILGGWGNEASLGIRSIPMGLQGLGPRRTRSEILGPVS